MGRIDSGDIGREVNNGKIPNRWRRDVESKTTRSFIGIREIWGRDEGIYSNDYGSVLLFQCRTNTLKPRCRQGFQC